ncbi:hypothetical protein JXA88_07600 [Candidatus Fermentibacteria bacterium]|nr:hypothetical protein [Candidatus Fermentibacteria bacterium]
MFRTTHPHTRLRLPGVRAHWLALLGLWGVLLWPLHSEAQYIVGPTVMAGGGARLTGGSYVITATSGQAGPIGVSTGGAYRTNHGFWYAVTGGGGGGPGLDPMVLSITMLNPTTARISWAAVTGATHYDLYRSTSAYAPASGSTWVTIVAPNTNVDTSAGIGDPNFNYFFVGIARNASDTSPESNRVGEFDFGADIPLCGATSPSGGDAQR